MAKTKNTAMMRVDSGFKRYVDELSQKHNLPKTEITKKIFKYNRFKNKGVFDTSELLKF